MAGIYSNHYLAELHKGNVDWLNDSMIVIIMATGFTFDRDAHATYANISASELATGNGYTQKTKALANAAIAEDDTNDRAEVTVDNFSWTASGGAIGPSPGVAVIDDTTADDTVVGYFAFGSEQTAADGAPFSVVNMSFRADG